MHAGLQCLVHGVKVNHIVGAKKPMRHKFLILLVSALSTGTVLTSSASPGTVPENIQALYRSRPPRTLEGKVEEADLIVRGNATLFGEEKWVLDFFPTTDKAWFGLGNNPPELDSSRSYTLFHRDSRIDVTEVLWPLSLKQITDLVFSCYIVKEDPPSWWAYTNTLGVFFLIKKPSPGKAEWTKLQGYGDWIEPTTNAPSIQSAIMEVKESGRRSKRQPDGAANGSQPIRSETNSTAGAAGSRR